MSETQESNNVSKYILAGSGIGLVAYFAWKYSGVVILGLFKKEQCVNLTPTTSPTNTSSSSTSTVLSSSPTNNVLSTSPTLEEEAECAIMMLALNTKTQDNL